MLLMLVEAGLFQWGKMFFLSERWLIDVSFRPKKKRERKTRKCRNLLIYIIVQKKC